MALTGSSIASTYLKLLRVNTDTMGADASASYIQDSADTDSALSISTTRVGIGTATPAGTASTSILDIENTTSYSATEGGNLRLGANNTSDAALDSGDRLGVIEFAGAEDGSSTMTIGARIEAIADNNWSASENGAYLSFYTTDGNDNQLEELRITAPGQVIISPGAVAGSAAAPQLAFGNGDTGFYENTDNQLAVALGAGRYWNFQTGYFGAEASSGGLLKASGATLSVPGVMPRAGDVNTGIGGDGSDALSLITGGSERMTIDSAGTQNQQANYIVNEQGRQDHVANTMPAPYYRFDGSNDLITVSNNAALNLGLGDFSICISIRPTEVSDEFLFGKYQDSSNKWNLRLLNGKPQIYGAVGGSSKINYITNDILTVADTNYHICFVSDRDGTKGQFYIDGVAVATTETEATATTTLDNTGDLYIGSESVTYANTEISNYSQWNKALSAAEVKELYSGASVPFKYKGANQTELLTNGGFASDTGSWSTTRSSIASVSGGSTGNCLELTRSSGTNQSAIQGITTVIGKRYRISVYVKSGTSGDESFKVYADGEVIDGTTTSGWVLHTGEYTATTVNPNIDLSKRTSTAGTMLFDSASVVQIGAVAEYDGSGVASDKWFDKSGNDLHGTVSGASVENAPSGDDGLVYEEGEHEPALTCASDGTFALNTGYETLAYTRIGRLVHVQGYLTIASESGTPDGALRMTLPYPVAGNTTLRAGSAYGGASIRYAGSSHVTGTYAITTIGNSYCTFSTVTEAGVPADVTHLTVDTAFEVVVGFSYITD